MRIKVISLEKCGGTLATIELVKKTADEMGIPIDFEHVIVHTQEDARLHRLIGSPTVQINGVDIEPEARVLQRYSLT
mgnify:CR=1 FL=1